MAQLSLTEVSKRFNVNRTTIYRAVSNGKLSRLSNGLFDLAEVIRVFGEAPTAEAAPVPEKESKLVEVLERELLFLKKQIEQKDNQINHLQRLLVAPETSAQRPEATTCNDTETPIDQAMQHNETPYEANSNATKQHDATAQNDTMKQPKKRGLFDRLDRGLKAFLK
ncbi:plasmid replication DNA-binding protein [Acinetobacter sp. YH12116]|uniref:plasmid replication DNA-binding protein n=1 Tax=Acinetobacter sp. YH12116 TaxID=2601103 RepID=UPI0015D14FC4|nr:plasmid replication DNA-binding protein [Acinetobacter sp. YH12116]